MKALRNVLSKALLPTFLQTWRDVFWPHRMNQYLAENAKHQYKQTKSTQNKKRHSSLIFAAVVCVYWYTGLSIVCYMKIFASKMLSMKIFFQNFVWQDNELVFISELKK